MREWLLGLDSESRRVVGADIATVEFGWPVGMPLTRSLGGGLHEVRSRITGGRIARVLFVIHESRIVLLHGFVKKAQKTPKRDLEIARKRAREIRHG
ncbi:type II toxin-antitoxin system RelE/ParE family toxin [Candidatus Palauibacter sp.]|uniref:type II toxin-antitoxin system RelE/ParE family toxin n=1 Tax=Candidatus Palauibacter sp. TaxID=3101350 RepID=UPI003AF22223